MKAGNSEQYFFSQLHSTYLLLRTTQTQHLTARCIPPRPHQNSGTCPTLEYPTYLPTYYQAAAIAARQRGLRDAAGTFVPSRCTGSVERSINKAAASRHSQSSRLSDNKMCIALWTRFPIIAYQTTVVQICPVKHRFPQMKSTVLKLPRTSTNLRLGPGERTVSPTKKTVLGNHASFYAWEQLRVTRIPGCLPSVSVDALALRVHIDKNATSILIEVKDMMWLPKRLME